MSKVYVMTKSSIGITTVTCPDEETAVKICVNAIAKGCYFAFYSK